MMGNFLTTLGNTPEQDRAMFEELGPERRAPARQRRQPAPGQPQRRGSRARRRDVVDEFLDDWTPSGEVDLTVRLWDPSTQLRYRAKDKAVPTDPTARRTPGPTAEPVGPAAA